MTGNPHRRIPYPLPAYGRKCADTEPVKLAEAAPAAEASFAGVGVQRAASPLCRGAGAAAHCWGQGATPIGRVQGGSACAVCRGGEPLLRCPEVENLGPGKVDACVNLYWVLPDADFRRICGFAALPGPVTSSQEGGKLFETDTT